MKTYKQVPHTIFFLNSGVKLTTTNSDIYPILKEVEAMGVEIYSCGTCLKYYGLEIRVKGRTQGYDEPCCGGDEGFPTRLSG